MNGTPNDISAAGEISAVERFGLVRVVNAQRDYAEGKNHRDQREIGDDDQLEAHSFPLWGTVPSQLFTGRESGLGPR